MASETFSRRQTEHFQLPELASLFPLPLTPFERFMILENRPRWPMTFSIQLLFRGALDRRVFETAVRDSSFRHPLLRAQVELSGRLPHWVLREQFPEITWLPESIAEPADPTPIIDLSKQSGLRILAKSGEEQSSVWLQVHHACCDGQGARRFVLDLLTGYARAFLENDLGPRWDVLDYESLRRRHDFTTGAATPQAQTSLWEKLRGAYHFHFLTPQSLAKVEGTKTQPAQILKHTIEPQLTAAIRQRAMSMGASVNDIGMALLFLTLAEWNLRHGSSSGRNRLRVMMPMDLRESRDDRMPATNRMSFSFIGRSIHQCQSLGDLLAGIRAETKYIKQLRLGLDFLGGITLAQTIPGLLPLLLATPQCMATALLTNLGDPTKRFRRRFPSQDGVVRIGNVLLESIFGTPPIRPRTHAGFGMCLCAGKLCLSMLGDGVTLGESSAELFDSHVRRWYDFASGH